tara:strand:+ start:920 stop:2305 length:1386 start_codon:yes stop_codon:yes gene_type:complete
MEIEFESLKVLNAIPALAVALGLLFLVGGLLTFGRRLEYAMRLERFGIPIALIVGILALCIGPYGPFSFLPKEVTEILIQLPTPLLTLVFATLMLGRPIPAGRGLLQPVASQALLGFFLGFGQYLVGGIVVLLILIPYLGVDPLMACLIEVGFEGGHGAASIMGDSFEKLGFSGGLDLGLAMATIGLLSSTLLGSILVILAKIFGWVSSESNIKIEVINEVETPTGILYQLKQLAINLGLAGLAVSLGLGMLYGLRLLAPFLGNTFKDVAYVFPVFPLALLGSFLIRFLLEKTGKTIYVSSLLQREIGIISTDLLITTAMAGLNLPLLLDDWIPLTVLALSGLTWNLFGMLLFSRMIFNDEWFERSITEFGNATGVAASGLLLLRLTDPRDLTNTLPIFSIKQLFLQPLLSGGLITVIAPIVINNIGLSGWTEFCGFIIVLFLIMAFLLKPLKFVEKNQLD